MLPGVLDSPTSTNDNYYPKIRIGRPGPNAFIPMNQPLAMLSFFPATAEIQISDSNTPQESAVALNASDRVAAALIELFRQSVLRSQ